VGQRAIAIEADDGWRLGGLSHGHLALQAEGAEAFFRSLECGRSPTCLRQDAVVLFDGSNPTRGGPRTAARRAGR
jgi:hypothetical protein